MSTQDKKHRSHLPMPNTMRTQFIAYDAKDPDSKFPPIEQLRPPQGAPNVLIILIDDAGFGSSSAFGGPCQTPNAEKLAADGLMFNRFHTTALCSPTRQALLTGRNHHSCGMGGITEIATGAPGYCSVLPNTMSPLAKTLKLNGYNTAQFGKCHEVPVWETSPVGPFNAWPTGGGGFEYFYGFIGGEANQWYPTLYEGTTPVEPEKTPEEGYHLMEDMTNKAMAWISQQKALAPDKPFFVYFAPGATHAPHHVPKEWADKYKGKFDQGWDKLRKETFARQKKLGVIPADCQLTPRHGEIPAWDEMPEGFKPFLRREAEVYAGYMEYTDHQVGRMLDGLKKLGVFEDTLVYYIIGDNGASAEGGVNGCFNEMSYFNGLQSFETPEYLSARLEKLGGPESYNHYAVGWAHAMNTPYQWTKQVASHWGGTRNGTIVSWPKGIQAKAEIRSQFSHVIDVAPTVLEAAGIPQPFAVDGIQQDPIEGTSMLYAFNDAKAAEQHETQYFEMFGNRGIYHKGWTAVTHHRTPWAALNVKPPAFDDDVWELYDTTKDWSQAKDLSKENPQKLHELQRLWLIEATRYKVLPIDDRLLEKMNPDIRRAADPDQGKEPDVIRRHGPTVGELHSEHQVNKSHTVSIPSAESWCRKKAPRASSLPRAPTSVAGACTPRTASSSTATTGAGSRHFIVGSEKAIPAGEHQVRMEFAYAGGGLGKGGMATLFIDGKKAGEGEIEATLAIVFSADDGCDVGEDTGAPVSPDYGSQGNAFNGEVKGVLLSIADDPANADHMVTAEDALRVAMARQ